MLSDDPAYAAAQREASELDRLRATLAAETKALVYMKGERDRLRAENERLQKMALDCGADKQELLMNIEGFKAEIDDHLIEMGSLRARVVELEDALDAACICLKNRDRSEREQQVYDACRAALAKGEGK